MWPLLKAPFLDYSLCVAPLQKHERRDTRLSSGRVHGTHFCVFLPMHVIRGDKEERQSKTRG